MLSGLVTCAGALDRQALSADSALAIAGSVVRTAPTLSTLASAVASAAPRQSKEDNSSQWGNARLGITVTITITVPIVITLQADKSPDDRPFISAISQP